MYLNLSDHLHALNISDGHIRWSDQNFEASPLEVVDGTLYTITAGLGVKPALYAVNPADGKIKATYTTSDGGWNALTVANGFLYYAIGKDIYEIRLTNHQSASQQHFAALPGFVEHIQVKNGIVYTQIQVISTATGSHDLIMAFDARTGNKLWVSKTDTEFLAITATIVYTTTINFTTSAQIDALDASTGKLLWHTAIKPLHILATSNWHSIINILVNPDTLYVSYGDRASAGSIAALQTRDGTLLWQTRVDNQEAESPLGVQDKVVYTISNNGENGAIDVFKATDGSRLWHMPMNGNAAKWQAVIA